MKKRLPSLEHADTLSLNALRGLVMGLLERSQQAEDRLEKIETETIQLREANAALGLENARGGFKDEVRLANDTYLISIVKWNPPLPKKGRPLSGPLPRVVCSQSVLQSPVE